MKLSLTLHSKGSWQPLPSQRLFYLEKEEQLFVFQNKNKKKVKLGKSTAVVHLLNFTDKSQPNSESRFQVVDP